MVHTNRILVVSRRNPPQNRRKWLCQKKTSVENDLKSSFLVINLYLWLRGIGFTQIKGYKAVNAFIFILSLILAAIFDGNILLKLKMMFVSVYGFEFISLHADVTSVFIFLVSFFLRLLFFSRRQTLRYVWQKICEMHAKIAPKKKISLKIKINMILLMFLNDFCEMSLLWMYFLPERYELTYVTFHYYSVEDEFLEWLFNPPDAFNNFLHTCVFLYHIYYPGGAVLALFYSVCVLHEGILQEMKKLCSNNEVEYFIEVYKEIFDLIQHTNRILRPFLLMHFSFLMAYNFLDSYTYIYHFKAKKHLVRFLFLYTNLVLVCMFSNRVVNAAKALNDKARKLSFPISYSKRFQFVLNVRREFSGFEILDSICLDSSFILTATGVLFSYGLLVANFSGEEEEI